MFKSNRFARWVVEIVIQLVRRGFRLIKVRITEYRIATRGPAAIELQIDLASTAAIRTTIGASADYIILLDPERAVRTKEARLQDFALSNGPSGRVSGSSAADG